MEWTQSRIIVVLTPMSTLHDLDLHIDFEKPRINTSRCVSCVLVRCLRNLGFISRNGCRACLYDAIISMTLF